MVVVANAHGTLNKKIVIEKTNKTRFMLKVIMITVIVCLIGLCLCVIGRLEISQTGICNSA